MADPDIASARPPQKVLYVSLAAAAILYLVVSLVHNPFAGDILTSVFLMAGLSLSWNILGGYTGQFSLGHAGFFGIGAYTSTLLLTHFQVNPWLGLVAGGVVAAVVGGLIFYPNFRLRGIFFCLASLAFTEVVRILAVHFRGLTEGAMGITIPFREGWTHLMFRDKTGYMLIALTFMLLLAAVTWRLEHSRFGFKMLAVREDEETAETLGISSAKTKLYATLVSAFFTGCLGTVYANYTLMIDPDSVFSVMLSVEFALLAILGGIGTILGPIIGAFILVPIDTLMRGYLGQAQQGLSFFAYGTLLIVVVLFLPHGVVSWFNRLTSRAGGGAAADPAPAQPEPAPAVVCTPFPDPADPPLAAPPPAREVLLTVQDVSKNFGGLRVINNLSLEVHGGEVVGLIGPNGAGKTTLFNLLCGFHRPDGGRVIFDGRDITGLRPANRIARLGLARTFQIVKPLPGLTVLENVVAGAVESSADISEARERSQEIIRLTSLERYQDAKATSLPLAGRKRLEVARALATRPKLILLDEVMAGLNPTEIEQAIGLIERIKATGVSLLVIEHVMKAIMRLADQVVVIHYGEKIFQGTPQAASCNQEVISAYLGKEYQP
ncbi:MAG: branched-chain amino acid ABC transporter ATP-binding protein/permease [Deltaproteobacteria bacterium]|nr:branched-chain amino acid ABC transporter ATP-binding protein/permease [Deltaproteobacteria bacterium]